jgi:sulfate transport system permease protein
MSLRFSFREPTVLPGFWLAMGVTVLWLLLVVIIPLSGLFVQAAGTGWEGFAKALASKQVQAAFRLSFSTAFLAAFINIFVGLLIAWVLVRYHFPGKALLDAMIDLPFALPTAVAGIALTALYAPGGWIGKYLEPLGIKVAFAPNGILIALIFISLPFLVRTVQPVLEDMEKEQEEAAASLGATRRQAFFRVVLPQLLPAILTGFAMAFARALGEYGSVIFIAGNIPMVSEIVPLLIVTRLEEYNIAGASVLAAMMLAVSFLLLLLINMLQQWTRKRGL